MDAVSSADFSVRIATSCYAESTPVKKNPPLENPYLSRFFKRFTNIRFDVANPYILKLIIGSNFARALEHDAGCARGALPTHSGQDSLQFVSRVPSGWAYKQYDQKRFHSLIVRADHEGARRSSGNDTRSIPIPLRWSAHRKARSEPTEAIRASFDRARRDGNPTWFVQQ